jgi:DNA-binding transcriptional MerR regulator
LTIQEVSQRLDISKHTLRFWEKELDGIIIPLRTKGGQRRYTLEHLFIIEEIKRLKRKGMSLLGIKRKLNNNHKDNDEGTEPQEVDILANQIAEIVRRAVYRYFEGDKSV